MLLLLKSLLKTLKFLLILSYIIIIITFILLYSYLVEDTKEICKSKVLLLCLKGSYTWTLLGKSLIIFINIIICYRSLRINNIISFMPL